MNNVKIFLLLVINLLPFCTIASDFTYLQQLVAQASVQKLADSREWQLLLHYQPTLYGYESEIDDPQFFGAPQGKIAPHAELAATLAAFFAPPVSGDDKQHPQCAWIARYHWLNQQLHFDAHRLRPQPCPAFETWLTQLQPVGITLIFPAAYLNNPSSMFGHTLLRIDQANQDEQTRMLAHVINYAASTAEENGMIFAVKGILGGYHGLFSAMPYHKKIKEYSDLENRDIWEYQLNFTLPEVLNLLRHLWELNKIYFDYYFFDENCAYHLLSLLEVARPTLQLRDQLPAWIIPGETVRIVATTPHLVKKTEFRPASMTRLRHRLHLLSPLEQEQVQQLATGQMQTTAANLTEVDKTSQAAILETAYDYLYYLHNKRNAEPDATRTQRLRALLVARSQLPARTLLTEPPLPPRPDEGHGSFRFTVGMGREGKNNYQILRLRPAYHDLLDPEAGYTAGAQINFLELAVRHQPRGSSFKFEGLKVIDIVSLTPIDPFFQPFSWKINMGLTRRPLNAEQTPLVFRTNGGIGFSYSPITSLLSYAFVESSLDVGSALHSNYALGWGANVGLLIGERSRWRLYATAHRFGLGHLQTFHEFGLEQRLTFSRNHALYLQLNRQYWDEAEALSQIELSWRWYF